MTDREVEIETKDGTMNAFISHPEESGPHPVVLFLMDAPAKREELHDMARRLGSSGYFVMLANLYYRRVREFVLDGGDDTRKIMMGHMDSLTNAMACEDSAAMLEFADSDPAAKEGAAGVVGYCMSGPFAIALAAAEPARIKAAASIHGIRLCTDAPDSPHLDLDKIKAELYFGFAGTDKWAPPEMVEALELALGKTSVRYRTEWYPDTVHGFVFPNRGAAYKRAAAERHWERLLGLFGRTL
jgi:carboxymethylenebutenolidase